MWKSINIESESVFVEDFIKMIFQKERLRPKFDSVFVERHPTGESMRGVEKIEKNTSVVLSRLPRTISFPIVIPSPRNLIPSPSSTAFGCSSSSSSSSSFSTVVVPVVPQNSVQVFSNRCQQMKRSFRKVNHSLTPLDRIDENILLIPPAAKRVK